MAIPTATLRCLVLCDIPALGLKCGQVVDLSPAVVKAHDDALDIDDAAVAAAEAAAPAP